MTTDRTERDVELAEQFSAARPRLVRVAYAILGTVAEAEDVVADCWLRLSIADEREAVLDVDGWTTVTVARAALDTYRSARRRREVYVGPWLPEPRLAQVPPDPVDRVTLDENVSFAMMVVLESLSPAERTTWVLHELFGLPFPDVAAIVGRTPAAVRQLAVRARTHLTERAPRFEVDAAVHRRAVDRFLAAAVGGRLSEMIAVLDGDVVLTSDGGGLVSAARRPVIGADRVARFLLGLAAKAGPGDFLEVIDVNGFAGVASYTGRQLIGVLSLTVVEGRISRVDLVRSPLKLRGTEIRSPT